MDDISVVKTYLRYWYDSANIQRELGLSFEQAYDFYVNKAEPNRLYPNILASSFRIAGSSKSASAMKALGQSFPGRMPNANEFSNALLIQVNPYSPMNFVTNVGEAIVALPSTVTKTVTETVKSIEWQKIAIYAGLIILGAVAVRQAVKGIIK